MAVKIAPKHGMEMRLQTANHTTNETTLRIEIPTHKSTLNICGPRGHIFVNSLIGALLRFSVLRAIGIIQGTDKRTQSLKDFVTTTATLDNTSYGRLGTCDNANIRMVEVFEQQWVPKHLGIGANCGGAIQETSTHTYRCQVGRYEVVEQRYQ
jgi:hypothetical protein